MASLSDLTPQEIKILELVLIGRTNKAIAAQIGVCEKTVEYHLNRIYVKIGAGTRVLAGIWAIEHGLEAQTREIPS